MCRTAETADPTFPPGCSNRKTYGTGRDGMLSCATSQRCRRGGAQYPGASMAAILQIPAWLGALLAMLLAITASAIPFIVLRRLLSDDLPTKTRDVAETVAV